MGRRSASGWYWLLLLPFIAMLSPVYLRAQPAIAGIPFFYWYQFALLIMTAVLTGIVYYATRDVEP